LIFALVIALLLFLPRLALAQKERATTIALKDCERSEVVYTRVRGTKCPSFTLTSGERIFHFAAISHGTLESWKAQIDKSLKTQPPKSKQ